MFKMSNMEGYTSQVIDEETPTRDLFVPPSIDECALHAGRSYSHESPIPESITQDLSVECALGVDEAGRGPVLGMGVRHRSHQALSE